MQPIIHKISIDLAKKGAPVVVDATQGDALSRKVEATLYNNGTLWTIPDDVTGAVLTYAKADGKGGKYDKLPDNSAAITVGTNSVSVILAPQVLTCPGLVRAAIKLTGVNNLALFTFPFAISVARSPEDGIESDDYSNVESLEELAADVEALGNEVAKCVKTVNGKQRDASGNVEIGAEDIDVEVASTQYQGDLAGALEDLGSRVRVFDIAVSRSAAGAITANKTYAQIKTAYQDGRELRVLLTDAQAQESTVLTLSQHAGTATSAFIFSIASEITQGEWKIVDLSVNSSGTWTRTEYFLPASPSSSNSGKLLSSSGTGWAWVDAPSGVKDGTADWTAWAATQSQPEDWIGSWAAAAGTTSGTYRVDNGTYRVYDGEYWHTVQISECVAGRQIIEYYTDDTDAFCFSVIVVYEPDGALNKTVSCEGDVVKQFGCTISVPYPSAAKSGYVLTATGAGTFDWRPLPS